MSGELESVHYYKIVKNFDINLKPYIEMPIYDDYPDKGTYQSTAGVSHPQKNDYIICVGEDIIFDSYERDFTNVQFSKEIVISELLEKKIIIEVSYDYYKLDMETEEKMREIAEDIFNTKMNIDTIMHENKDCIYSLEDLRKEQIKLKNLEKQLEKQIEYVFLEFMKLEKIN